MRISFSPRLGVGIDRVTGWDLSESNSSSVDNVFDTYINCAREDCEKRELAACKTLGSLVPNLIR